MALGIGSAQAGNLIQNATLTGSSQVPSGATFTIQAGGTLNLSAGTITFPSTVVLTTATQTLTNKTITSSSDVIGGVTLTLGSDATGDVYYRSSGGVLTRLGIGSTGQVLTISGGLPLWGAAGNPATYTINTQTMNYTAVLSDAGKLVLMNSGTNLTIPPNSSVAFPVGSFILVSGNSTAGIVAGAGVTIHTNPLQALSVTPYSLGKLVKTGTDIWQLDTEVWGFLDTLANTSGMVVANGTTLTQFIPTTGSVLFAAASGQPSQDNANFFWDATDHWLGIGTATPLSPLMVQSQSGAGTIAAYYTDGATYTMSIGSLPTFGGAFITGTAGSTLNLGSNGVTRIVLDNSGNIILLGNVLVSTLSASKPVFTNGSQVLVSGAFSLPQIVGSGDVTAQSAANTSVATYTTPNDSAVHSFRVGCYANITAISAGTLTQQVAFTDENNAAQTLTFFGMGLTSAGLTSTGFTGFAPMNIRCKSNTAITVKTTFTGVSITYDDGATIESLY